MSKYTEAINFVDIARMNYICDPQECGLEKGEDPCTAFHCDEMHDALVMAIEALEIANRLEQMWEEVKDKEFTHSMFQNCRECGDYMQGVKDTLADVRGDNK